MKKWMDLQALLQHPNPEARERWQRSSTKEYGSLFQGHNFTEEKNVLSFMKKEEVPSNTKATYPRTTVAYRP